jgi:hypothetical protein
MLRMIVCAALGLMLFAGDSQAGNKVKGKGKKGVGVTGTFESYKDGTLTIQTKGKKGALGPKREFKVAEDTSVTVVKGEEKTELKGGAGFKDVAAGTRVSITTDDTGKISAIQVGGAAKKKTK